MCLCLLSFSLCWLFCVSVQLYLVSVLCKLPNQFIWCFFFKMTLIFLFLLQCISIVHTLYPLFQSIGNSNSLFPSNGIRYSVIFLKYLRSYWVELAWKAKTLILQAHSLCDPEERICMPKSSDAASAFRLQNWY